MFSRCVISLTWWPEGKKSRDLFAKFKNRYLISTQSSWNKKEFQVCSVLPFWHRSTGTSFGYRLMANFEGQSGPYLFSLKTCVVHHASEDWKKKMRMGVALMAGSWLGKGVQAVASSTGCWLAAPAPFWCESLMTPYDRDWHSGAIWYLVSL